MNEEEARVAIKAIFYQAAFSAGLGVSKDSAERWDHIVRENFDELNENNKPKAVAAILQIIAESILYAKRNNLSKLTETSVDAGRNEVCPVFPFD